MTVEEASVMDEQFKFEMTVELSNVKYLHQRSIMTFLDVIGNVGGFNDAVWLFASFFLGPYSSLMYTRSIASKTPFTSKKSAKHKGSFE